MSIKIIVTTLFVFILLAPFISYAQKISLYNYTGEAVAYIVDDDMTIYLSKGDGVAYLDDQSIYGLNGKHLGWFKDGILWDHEGCAVGYIEGAYSKGVFSKVAVFESLKGRRAQPFFKSFQDPLPIEPVYKSQWATQPMEKFFALEPLSARGAFYLAPNYLVVNNVWDAQVSNGEQWINPLRRQSYSWNWNWRDKKAGAPVSYPSVIFGDKPWDGQRSTTPLLPCPMSRVKQLYVTHDYALHADGKYNVAYNLWLTDGPLSSMETIRVEIMVWIESAGDIQPFGFPGYLVDDTESYTLYKHKRVEGKKSWDCYSFKMKKPRRSALVNLGELLQNLINKQGISPDLYLADVEFGTEIWDGQGQMDLKFYQVLIP
ncbi:MAG: hypothetical protein FDX02_00480 [Chlorobium sp.]|nr:MAG: hypothetical protein FDX02_00480 [Chlorobium sp.]